MFFPPPLSAPASASASAFAASSIHGNAKPAAQTSRALTHFDRRRAAIRRLLRSLVCVAPPIDNKFKLAETATSAEAGGKLRERQIPLIFHSSQSISARTILRSLAQRCAAQRKTRNPFRAVSDARAALRGAIDWQRRAAIN